MATKTASPEDYLAQLPDDRRQAVSKLRNTISRSLPKGFREVMGYGMICYVVPHELYPPGYHCDPKQPLFLMGIASQKNYVVMHHMGIYGSPELLKWFTTEYPKHSKSRLDMGKGCVRFKKMEDIPYPLIGDLARKITVKDWIETTEKVFKRKK
jgi:uncharacterized protein YdhG (YjbR/CyaY superfamily)